MDNLNTHTRVSLYRTFASEKVPALLDNLEFVYTPKHGSWMNMAECEFSVLSRRCLDRRIAGIDTLRDEVNAWTEQRKSDEQASGVALYHRRCTDQIVPSPILSSKIDRGLAVGIYEVISRSGMHSVLQEGTRTNL